VHKGSEHYPVSYSIGNSRSVLALLPTGPRGWKLNFTYYRSQSRVELYFHFASAFTTLCYSL